MKNIFYFTVLFFYILMGCKKDVEQPTLFFDVKVQGNEDFLPKGINEKTRLHFEISADYDYEKAPLKYQVVSSAKGDFYNGKDALHQNQPYVLKELKLDLDYLGKEKGVHKIKIKFFNDDIGVNIIKEVELNYESYDFNIEVIDFGEVYQGKKASYTLKISSVNPVSNGYEIKFDDFDTHPNSKIFLYEQEIILGKYYPINKENLENIKITTNCWNSGTKKLVYTIKNSTVTRAGNEIIQNVLQRRVDVISLTPSGLSFELNKNFSINGIVIKKPFQDNQDIYYKTWISSSNPKGITTTNNQWVKYPLGNDNVVNINNLQTKSFGIHTYNVQFKDEFGNESSVISFDIKVEESLHFVEEPKAFVSITRIYDEQQLGFRTIRNTFFYYKGTRTLFKAKTGLNNKIIRYKVDISFIFEGEIHNKSYTKNFEEHQTEIVIDDNWQENEKIWHGYGNFKHYAKHGEYVVYVYDSQGNIIEKRGNLTFHQDY
ncbi:hypothetical protein [Capnocytophaga stomatis]|uniref:hypothetical protein n=1 Tax=Capnocytophaga stomatis TaxID=1848904 RepID=UPI00194F5C9D|nr:hypothetical protein [Capnocytophaga stomatis]